METKHLSKGEFDRTVDARDDLVIVDFLATWCGPCKMLSPVMERMTDRCGDIHSYKVDTDEEIDLTFCSQVMGVPTLLYMKRGEIVGKFVGLISPVNMEREIQKSK